MFNRVLIGSITGSSTSVGSPITTWISHLYGCTEWNTTDNPHLAAAYSADSPDGKSLNKRALQRELGLPLLDGVPLLGNISRFTDQKGIDILLGALEALIGSGAAFQFAGLGSGDPLLEKAMSGLTKRHPEYRPPCRGRSEACSGIPLRLRRVAVGCSELEQAQPPQLG